ncbi:hypothetical protein [Ensifer aridi]|uniref:hypothetical protein n=1 Tax=Ensifer aridi TaxID=1708715 RepID=UPI000A10947A|nr:hypothetical protein [Ensifer aridi]
MSLHPLDSTRNPFIRLATRERSNARSAEIIHRLEATIGSRFTEVFSSIEKDNPVAQLEKLEELAAETEAITKRIKSAMQELLKEKRSKP